MLSEAGRRNTADVQAQTTPIVARSFDRPILRNVDVPYSPWEDDDEPDERGPISESDDDDDDYEGMATSEHDEAYRAYVIREIEAGLADDEAGRVISSEELRRRMSEWYRSVEPVNS